MKKPTATLLIASLALLGLLPAVAPWPAYRRLAVPDLARPWTGGTPLAPASAVAAAPGAETSTAYAAAGRPAQAEEPSSLTLAMYWRQLQATQGLVNSVGDRPAVVRRILLQAAADGWLHVTAVVLSNGTSMPLDHAFLAARLSADPPNLKQLAGLLSTLLAARDTWPQLERPAADLDALESILARSEFQWPVEKPSPLAQWWQQVQEWFWKVLGQPISTALANAAWLRHVLTALGVIALGIALFYALRGLLPVLVPEKELDQEEAAEEDLTTATALRRANVLAGGGDYRSAARYLYLSALLLLEENGLLRYDRSLTNREYLRNVAATPELAAALRRVIEVFERVWYGYHPLDAAGYSQYGEWVAELRRLR